MKYYYTIGEVSNLLDVKPYVIRYWETEFPQLKPRKAEGRIRKYNEDQILVLKKIKYMLYDQRFTIEGARNKLKLDKQGTEQIEIELFKARSEDRIPASSDHSLLKDIRAELLRFRNTIANYHRSNK